jgi:Domain of unknown function (DUF4388)
MSLIGTLSEIKLADVLQLFASGGKTGLLTVSATDGQAFLRFHRGALVYAASGRLQGDEAVLDLFGWRDGQMNFVPEEKDVTPNVTRTVEALVDEGPRVGDRVHRMNLLIPTDRIVFQTRADPPEDVRYPVGAVEWQVVRVLRDLLDVRQVVEATKLGRADVLRVLFEMTEAGLLERVDVERTLRVHALGLFGKDTAELDPRIEVEWKRIAHLDAGVLWVEVSSPGKKPVVLHAAFRPGLNREIHLPRATLAELGLRGGEEVFVRPAV